MSQANRRTVFNRLAFHLAIPLILTLATVFVGCKGSAPVQPSSAVTSAPARAVAAHADNDCLSCHGPYEDVIKASAAYQVPGGEKTNPHRYVPHDSKLAADIPDCTHCHSAHPLDPLPAKGSVDLSKLSVDWCYSCHHEKNFKSCKDCH